METFSGTISARVGFPVKKKRSCASRQPCLDTQKFLLTHTLLPPAMQSFSSWHGEHRGCFVQTEADSKQVRHENRLEKIKFKFVGVSHMVPSAGEYSYCGSSIPNSSRCVDERQLRQNLPQVSHLATDNPSIQRGYKDPISGEILYSNETYNCKPLRRSKRILKRSMVDVGFGQDEDKLDEEICYLGRHDATEVSTDYDDRREIDNVTIIDMEKYGTIKPGGDGRKKLKAENTDEDYEIEEGPASEDETEGKSKLKAAEGRTKQTCTAHDWPVLQSASLIEFPHCQPHAPQKKNEVKLSEVDQKLKKAEAARKRKLQLERAAKEAEAEAIRKILGQAGGRKKKEEKRKKEQDELAQGKDAKAGTLGSNTVRWVIGANGTYVIFSNDIDLPSIFNSVPSSYPAPREKCAGPNCTNAHKYRDSKFKLPLCSLHCYKAIHGNRQSLIAC